MHALLPLTTMGLSNNLGNLVIAAKSASSSSSLLDKFRSLKSLSDLRMKSLGLNPSFLAIFFSSDSDRGCLI